MERPDPRPTPPRNIGLSEERLKEIERQVNRQMRWIILIWGFLLGLSWWVAGR